MIVFSEEYSEDALNLAQILADKKFTEGNNEIKTPEELDEIGNEKKETNNKLEKTPGLRRDSESSDPELGRRRSSDSEHKTTYNKEKVKCLSGDYGIPSVEKIYESEEEKIFTRALYKFMADKGQPILKVPSLGFQDLNLYKLYQLVIKRGGMENVTKYQAWKAVYLDLGLSTMSTSASYNTRTNYKK